MSEVLECRTGEMPECWNATTQESLTPSLKLSIFPP
jgi:hypothetical protein